MLRKIAIPVLLMTVIALCFAFTSCKKDCNHEYGDWTVSKEATCTEAGEEIRTCSICNEAERRAIGAIGHTTDALLCGTCGETIVGLDSLFPSVDYEGLSSVGVVIKDVIISDIDEASPGESVVTTLELAEMVIYIDENDELRGYADGEARISLIGYEESRTSSVFAVLEDGVLYAHISNAGEEQYLTTSFASVVNENPEVFQAITVIETLLPSLEEWFNKSLLPCFSGIDIPDVELPELNEQTASKALLSVLNLFFTPRTTEDGTIVALDLSIIKDAHNALNDNTVAELIDLIGGDGSFVKLKALIPRVLEFKVEDLITFINLNLGVDIPALLASLDELAVTVTGVEGATIEMLIGIDGDIDSFLADEALLATSVKDVLMASLALTSEDELNAFINQLLTMLETTTVYQLAEVPEEKVAEINEIIDSVSEMLTYEIAVDKNGKFIKAELKLSAPNTNVSLIFTDKKISFNTNDGTESNSISVDIIPGYTPRLNEERAEKLKAKFANLPAINEDILAINDVPYIPIYENDVLVGAVLLADYTNLGYNSETGTYEANLVIYTVDLSAPLSVTIKSGCGSKGEYEYEFAAIYEVRLYSYSENDVDLTATDLGSAFFELVLKDAPYNVEFSEAEGFTYSFCYDAASGELVEDYDHNMIYSEGNSSDLSLIDCGDAYYLYYVCENCGAVERDFHIKTHNESDVTKAVTYDEATATYTSVLTCDCGEAYATNTYTVLNNSVSLVADEESLDNLQPDIDFSYTITEAGTYRFYFNSDSSGYVHIYKIGYLDTAYFGNNYEGYIDLKLDAGDGYFTILFFDELSSHNVSFGMEKIS